MDFLKKDVFLNQIIDFIKLCNEEVLKIYNTPFEVYYKNDNSPLTVADKRVNTLICDFLKKTNQNFNLNIPIISEENKNISFYHRKEYKLLWIVDPIDGTKEFIKKNGEFTINIGLISNKTPIFGIVSIPVTGEIYYGIKDVGSFKIDSNGINKLKIKNKDLNIDGLKIIASKSHLNNDTINFISNFSNPKLISVGSSIKLLYIAENRADIYPRLAPTSEWDTCAAHAIVKYAGGKVLQFENRPFNELDEVVYNKPNLLNPYFLCY